MARRSDFTGSQAYKANLKKNNVLEITICEML